MKLFTLASSIVLLLICSSGPTLADQFTSLLEPQAAEFEVDCDTLNRYSSEYQLHCGGNTLELSPIETTLSYQDIFSVGDGQVKVDVKVGVEITGDQVEIINSQIAIAVYCINCNGDTAYMNYLGQMSILKYLNTRMEYLNQSFLDQLSNFFNGSLSMSSIGDLFNHVRSMILKNGVIHIYSYDNQLIAILHFTINHIDFDDFEVDVNELLIVENEGATSPQLEGLDVYNFFDETGQLVYPPTTVLDSLPFNVSYQCKTIHGIIEGMRYSQTYCGYWPNS